jgi:hypothetical protein
MWTPSLPRWALKLPEKSVTDLDVIVQPPVRSCLASTR